MDAPSASTRDLARRVVALEAAQGASDVSALEGGHEAAGVCAKLGGVVMRFAGPDGFTALLRRAVALARAEVPALKGVQVTADGRIQTPSEGPGATGAAGAEAIMAHLLWLLVTFIGEALAMQLVHEAWPEIEPGEGLGGAGEGGGGGGGDGSGGVSNRDEA